MGGSVTYGISALFNSKNVDYFSIDIELQANPSSTNYIDYFIAADTVVELAKNGYFIRFGDLKDEISFYELTNGIKTELISGTDGELNKSSNIYSIILSRDTNKLWKLTYVNSSTGNKFSAYNIIDTGFTGGKYTGIKIVQNGTSIIGKHFFDNIYSGITIKDTFHPKITSIIPIGTDSITVICNEPLQQPNISHFKLNGISPDNIIYSTTEPDKFILIFNGKIIANQQYRLEYDSIKDIAGNTGKKGIYTFNTYLFVTPLRDNIIITEIMAKPSPGLGIIPETEYLEIYNRSNKYLRLKNCILKDASTSTLLPDSVLFPGEYAVISKNSLPKPGNGKWIATSTFPTLNDDGDNIELQNPSKSIITAVSYSESWHSSAFKKAGGWSLELIDTLSYCIQSGNWSSNNNTGGTPCAANSIASNIAEMQNKVFRVYCTTPNTVRVYFKFAPDSISAVEKSNYTIVDFFENPVNVSFRTVDGNSFCDLTFNSTLLADQKYFLNVKDISSCKGQNIQQENIAFGFGSGSPAVGDLRINEILFDPKDDESDYVEIVNTSGKIIDLKHVLIANKDDNGVLDKAYIMAADGYQLMPDEYVLLTTNAEATAQRYFQNNKDVFVEIPALPTFSNDKGHAAIINSFGETLDELKYSDDWHSDLISNPDGISLEKTSPGAKSNDAAYWFSCTENASFGTPGMRNSQWVETKETKKYFTPESPHFSPDGDGMNDLLIVHYSLPFAGYFINVKIFNENGGNMGTLYQNYSLSQEGYITWDGTTDKGLAGNGNYVLYLEGFHENGHRINDKLTITVLRKQ